MTRKRFAIALAKLIRRDLDNPRALRKLVSHIPEDLEEIAEYVEKIETELKEVKKENKLLLEEFDKQDVFPFINIAEPTRNPPGTHPEPTRNPPGTHPEPTRNLLHFKVVGED